MVASLSLEDTYVGLAPEEYTKKIIIILNVIIDKQFLNIVLSLITVLLESCSTAISVKGLQMCKSVFSKHKVNLLPILFI